MSLVLGYRSSSFRVCGFSSTKEMVTISFSFVRNVVLGQLVGVGGFLRRHLLRRLSKQNQLTHLFVGSITEVV